MKPSSVDSAPVDSMELVESSPAAVLRKDKPGWLALFAEDAFIEDPVGAARYTGQARLSAFWDVFIAPQSRIVFHPRRDFVSPDLVVREVAIETLTAVGPTPLTVDAILEYRLSPSRKTLASMRAFWNPRVPVRWHLGQGLSGMTGLLRHSGRLLAGLGLGSALGFSRAMVPSLSEATARSVVEQLTEAPRGEWMEAVAAARISVRGAGQGGHDGDGLDPETAWQGVREGGGALRPESITVAGDHVAAILVGETRSLAAIIGVERGRVVALTVVGA